MKFKKLICCCFVLIVIFLSACVVETIYITDKNFFIYEGKKYNLILNSTNDWAIVGQLQTDICVDERLKRLKKLIYKEGNKEVIQDYLHKNSKDANNNVLLWANNLYIKEGFELINKYDATITSVNVKNINRELNANITLPSNLTLKDIIDIENKIESIPQEVPYNFIDIRVEEYSYLMIYEVLRVYNGEVYINLTPSREDSTRYNYPIKEEYKTYFISVIEYSNNSNTN